ncbi:hypothetical protein HNQ94_001542 [Salirhabdus euzebyi]|uniref:YkoP-like domain-containing protein n=1 Tax=Salirhabdus euzebyi TaxID=394506 RepID=A0A841Q3X6_9BACI|nr:hypothetical protein [Salirhabdus euzebyi]MBB6453094.1 hypothetical protein [Salirhabdus euzebyi]
MRRYFIKLWLLLDPFYYRLTRLTYIGKYQKRHSNIFRVRLTKYKGRPVTLSDGTEIKKNDVLIKIHLHNVRILNELDGVNNDIKKAFLIYALVKDSMPGLATYILTHKKSPQIKGIIGITTLNKGIKRLGFESFSIYNRYYRMIKMLTFFPIYLLSLSKPSIKQFKLQPDPKYIIMSKNQLITKYVKPPSKKQVKQKEKVGHSTV